MFLKIVILLALVVAFLWLLRSLGSESKRKRSGSGSSRGGADAEDMRQCRACGTYVPSVRPQSCGRPDCPFPARRG